tara:strand:- start:1134 stop:1901 length:768 start_codon:yes stop_codon:yes gene_type:complete
MKNINAKINEKLILKNINLELFLGENITIIGPNGSGKSTLIKLINRSIYPIVQKNSIFQIFNKDLINIWDIRRFIGFVNTDIEKRIIKQSVESIDVVLSGLDGTIGSPMIETKNELNIIKAQNIMEIYGMQNYYNSYFNELSDGQQRKLLIARSLISNPKILIFDEPFIGLDIKSKYSIINTINKLSKKSITIVLVTNSLDNISRKSDRVICIKSGELYKDGKPSDILNSDLISNLYDTNVDLILSNGYWRSIPK